MATGRELAASFASTLTLLRNLKLYAQVDGKFDYFVYNLTRDLRDRVVQPSNSADVNLPAEEGGYTAYERQRRLGPFYAQTSGASVGAALVRGPYIVPGDFVRLREVAVTNENFYRSARNVKPVLLATATDVNTEQLLAFDKIIVTEKALEQLAERTTR